MGTLDENDWEERSPCSWEDAGGYRIDWIHIVDKGNPVNTAVPKAIINLPRPGDIYQVIHAHIQYEIARVFDIVYQYSSVKARFDLQLVQNSANQKKFREFNRKSHRGKLPVTKTVGLQVLRQMERVSVATERIVGGADCGGVAVGSGISELHAILEKYAAEDKKGRS